MHRLVQATSLAGPYAQDRTLQSVLVSEHTKFRGEIGISACCTIFLSKRNTSIKARLAAAAPSAEYLQLMQHYRRILSLDINAIV